MYIYKPQLKRIDCKTESQTLNDLTLKKDHTAKRRELCEIRDIKEMCRNIAVATILVIFLS